MSNVFVLDTHKQALNPVHPGRARLLLSSGQAAVFKRYPFTIILKVTVEHPKLEPLRLKLDPGSKTTGMAIVNSTSGEVVFAAELTHRGSAIKERLQARRAIRHSRRARHTRYRQSRFDNRHNKKKGWLPPSLESRLANILTQVKRLLRLCPITAITQELVKFDLQQMDKPEISGVQYQQGTLAGYELREYLLEKWQRKCAYCGATDVPLQIEHIHPRSKGGTDRVGNLTLACEPCNIAKGANDIREFLKDKPEVLKRILAQAKGTLKDPMEQFPPYGINHRRIFECPFRLSQDALEDLWLVLEKLSDIVCPLGNVARFTGQREIADAIGASLAPGMDVFNLQRHVAFPAVGASTLPLFQ